METHQYKADELGITPVIENSPIPLYQQVRIELMGMLQSGKLKPGDMLPPEKDLANAYCVSRQTIRQAIGLLASSNLLERTPGRGTTVLDVKTRLKFFLDQSFAQQIISMGLTPHSEVLRKKITKIDGSTPSTLRSKSGSHALELIRLRFGDDYPIGVQYTIIVTDLCPDLHTQDFEKESLYHLLFNHYKLLIVRIDHTVSAVFPDEWHKNLLKVTNASPLILVNTTAYLDNNEPIEASTSYYRADRYEFSISKNY
ncbi:MAG: GntR family transcriptional regulator [Chloroflexota bacterium]|nr:GntR family transcriptional regulator [Chloroflexota bacterium]